MRFVAILFFALISSRADASSFHYEWKVDDAGYDFKLKMIFAKSVSLPEVIYNLNDVELPKRLNSTMEVAQKINDQGSAFDWITRFKAIGLTFGMQSHCVVTEKLGATGQASWSKHCELEPDLLDSKKFLKRKIETVTCSVVDQRVNCDFQVAGEIKNLPFMKSSTVTLKAKSQGLVNWGKFWYYTNAGSVSAKLSKAEFDRSRLNHDIEVGEADGLERAKAEGAFHFERAGDLMVPEARE